MVKTTAMIEVLDPTAKAQVQETPPAPRLSDLHGKVAGFLDNTKPNADIFLTRIKDLLIQKYQLKDVLWVAKHSAAAPLAEGRLAQLKERCDFVINAWGD